MVSPASFEVRVITPPTVWGVTPNPLPASSSTPAGSTRAYGGVLGVLGHKAQVVVLKPKLALCVGLPNTAVLGDGQKADVVFFIGNWGYFNHDGHSAGTLLK